MTFLSTLSLCLHSKHKAAAKNLDAAEQRCHKLDLVSLTGKSCFGFEKSAFETQTQYEIRGTGQQRPVTLQCHTVLDEHTACARL